MAKTFFSTDTRRRVFGKGIGKKGMLEKRVWVYPGGLLLYAHENFAVLAVNRKASVRLFDRTPMNVSGYAVPLEEGSSVVHSGDGRTAGKHTIADVEQGGRDRHALEIRTA